MKSTSRHRRRRAIAGIVSAIILFTMLFTVGLSFILFVSNGNQLVAQALGGRNLRTQSARLENLLLTTSVDSTNNHLLFTATNNGGITTEIVGFFATNQSGSYNNTSSFSPVVINPANTSRVIPTNVLCIPKVNHKCSVKVVTSRGNTYAQTFPSTPVLSQGTGLFSLDFISFMAYNTTGNCDPKTVGCQLKNGVRNYNLTAPKSLNKNSALYYVFSLKISNNDPCLRNATINYKQSGLLLLQVNGTTNTWWWRMGSVDQQTNTTTSPMNVLIEPLQSVTLYFTVNPPPPNENPRFPLLTAVFVNLVGSVSASPIAGTSPFPGQVCPSDSFPYGQNIPVVTLYFYTLTIGGEGEE